MLYNVTIQTKFPYLKCTSTSRLDGVLIQQLKETVCHLDVSIWGVRDYQFSVLSHVPGCLLDYEIKLSDEGIIAGMGVFYPSAFCLPSHTLLMRGQEPQGPDREDVLDESPDVPPARSQIDEDLSIEEQLRKVFDSHSLQAGEVGLPEVTRRLRRVDKGGVLSLDQAVHLSISCASMYSVACNIYFLID